MSGAIEAVAGWGLERVRDLLMWPANLIRDFPVRAVRLLGSVGWALLGILLVWPELFIAGRNRELRLWTRWKAGRAAHWGHRFLSQLFDLVGGPDVAQFVLRLVATTTPLTRREIEAAASVLGPAALRFGDVRVAEGGLLGLVFKYNGQLAFAAWHTVCLPRTGRHTRSDLSLLIHELAHVYQYERVGSRYIGEAVYMLATTRRDCYDYGGAAGLTFACQAGQRFRDFNREQQAKIAQDYFNLRQANRDVSAFEPLMAQLRAGEL